MHEVLPSEIMGMIFEEHTKLEWRAPVIDGRLCRSWRQIVLSTPRAWAYLEIYYNQLRIEDLRSWLHRSGTALLHIRIEDNIRLDSTQYLHDLLGDHHARIASLRITFGDHSFFEQREFPCLQLLEVGNWYRSLRSLYPVQWAPMPTLRSLRSGPIDSSVVERSELPSLEVLALWTAYGISLKRHFQSLTTLMLDSVSLEVAISGPVDFPSLDLLGLKPYVNAPRLTTYHEGGCTLIESFLVPLHSLVEYGVHGLWFRYSEWHRAFPSLSRLSIRTDPPLLKSFLDFFFNHRHSFPALQTISAGCRVWGVSFTEEDQEIMEGRVRDLDIVLRFEVGESFHIPIFFGEVAISHQIIYNP